MFEEEIKRQRETLYKIYNEEVKPLVAEIEARFEEFPEPLLAEMFFFNDYIARCYYDSEVPVDETLVIEKQKKEIDKAEGHIRRLILDCFKQLNASLSDTLKRHEKKMKYMDPVRMGKSNEWNTYRELKVCAVEAVYNAKIQESINTEKSMELFEKSYLQYRKLEELFDQQAKYIHKERINAVVGFIIKGVVWLILLLVSSFLSVLFGDFLLNLF